MWRSAVQVCLGLRVGGVYLSLFSRISFGGLAQLARALAWHARGHRFDPDILHFPPTKGVEIFDILTHKTVSKDFKLITECIKNNSQFTAESMS